MHPIHGRLRRRSVVFASVVAAAAVTVSVPSTTAAAAPTAPPSKAAAGEAPQAAPLPVTLDGVGAGPHTVTLVTGDRVTLTGAGRGYQVDVVAAPRPAGVPEPIFRSDAGPDGVFVIPEDVRPAVENGTLDRGLFDVKYLIENGYGDDAATAVPVIVQYPHGARSASARVAADALPGSTATADLPSIDGAAVSVPKAQAARFFASVHTTAGSRARGAALSGGVAKVWLDRKVKADLAESVPLIGVPAAWESGLDGRGVQVAILDTGIDDTHPDLAGKVAQARSFVPGAATVRDGHGHGTHVASTVAGSGAASGGKYRGVAPGAQLAIGKVLDDSGNGQTSWIIDGMEWAATSGAKVVSMSLGGGPSDGNDPLSQAVNDLTAQTGTLFVIAAGNDGPSSETLGAPGSADAALTVAATDKSDGLASFSSRGPRLDGALKPDIAAPGVNITAARAEGTALGPVVDERYTTISGTSMATPHVSGAAAILAQAHPEWTAAQLKAALMSTATDAGHTVFEQGAGRLDVARAVRQRVFAATANVDFGVVEADAAPSSRDVTYTNTGDDAVTLSLTARLSDSDGAAVDGALTAPGSVTVPAGGSATVTVGLDVAGLTEGRYTGVVLAETADGVRVTTPVAVLREPPKVTLTINDIGPDGQPVPVESVSVLDVSGDRGAFVAAVRNGVARVRVTPGVYSVSQSQMWFDAADEFNQAWLLAPEVVVTGDTEITLDARAAQRYDFDTPKPAEITHTLSGTSSVHQRTTENGQIWASNATGLSSINWWVTPTRPVSHGGFLATAGFSMGRPEVAMRVRSGAAVDLHPSLFVHTPTQYDHGYDFVSFTTGRLGLVDVGTGRPEDLAGKDVRGRLALLDMDEGCDIRLSRFQNVRDAGAAAIVAWVSAPTNGCFPRASVPLGITRDEPGQEPRLGIPYASLPATEARALRSRLATGPVTVDVTGASPQSPYVYELMPFFAGQVPGQVHLRVGDRDLARIDTDFHTGEPASFVEGSVSFRMDQLFVTGKAHQVFTGPGSRTTYKGPLYRDVIHRRYVFDTRGLPNWNTYDVFDAPVRTHRAWNAAPVTLGAIRGSDAVNALPDPDAAFAEQNWFAFCETCRGGDFLYPSYAWVSGDRSYLGGILPRPGSIHLYRGEEEVPAASSPSGFFSGYELAKESTRYRLTLDDAGSGNSAEWTFTSKSPTRDTVHPGWVCAGYFENPSMSCQPQPLVFVNYDLGSSLRLDNTVDPRGTHRFRVNAYHQQSRDPMPKIAGLRLWASTDGGKHWSAVPVRAERNGTYTAAATYPKQGGGTVSLKAEAWDTAGNRVVQTTADAFGLRARKAPAPTSAL